MRVFILMLLSLNLFAAEPPIITPKPNLTMALWPSRPLTTPSSDKLEYSNIIKIKEVVAPSLELYKSKKPAASAPAVVIFPGGGYGILAYDLEGTEIATWLNSIGFHAIVVRYTVPGNKRADALQDAQRAVGIVRSKASEWGINPAKIGVLGFSAGGHLSAHVSTNYAKRTYEFIDEADKVSCRPDFSVLVYPAYLYTKRGSKDLPAEIKVDAQTPPAFVIQTLDDRNFVAGSFNYVRALQEVKVDAELHLYAKGGHGYGLRKSKIGRAWPQLCAIWLKDITK